jgi:hypothetical protein
VSFLSTGQIGSDSNESNEFDTLLTHRRPKFDTLCVKSSSARNDQDSYLVVDESFTSRGPSTTTVKGETGKEV